MSDTPITDDFAASEISFSPDLQPRPDEPVLSEDEATRILVDRFANVERNTSFMEDVIAGVTLPISIFQESTQTGRTTDVSEIRRNLMIRLVRMMPETHRTASVLSAIDIRGLLHDLGLTPDEAATTQRYYYLNGVPVLPEERVAASEILAEQNAKAKEAATVMLAGSELSPEQYQQRYNEIVYGYRDTDDLGPDPDVAVDLAQSDAEDPVERENELETAQGFWDYYLNEQGIATEAQASQYKWVTQEDLTNMFQMDMVNWNQILTEERNKTEARELGMPDVPQDFQVDAGNIVNRFDVSTSTSMRLLDIWNALFDSRRSSTELVSLQQKLVAGGYLNEADIQYRGRATDRATQDAWRTLIHDSINTGTDMRSLLADATIAKREAEDEEAQSLTRDIILSSSPGIRTLSDQLGQQVLGRTLNGSDHGRLVEFIHGLERTAQTTVAREGSQTVEDVDVQAEIEEWISREYSTEAGAMDVSQQFQSFSDIARGTA